MITTNMASEIQEKQNKPANLRLLAAQRQLYSEAKHSMSWRVVISISLLFFPCVAAFVPVLVDSEGWVSIVGIAFLIVTYLLLKPKEEKLVETAAKIQQEFDMAVLGVPQDTYNENHFSEDLDISNAARRHLASFSIKLAVEEGFDKVPKTEWERMRLWDWYEVPANMDANRAALFCQKSNLLWDYRQRHWYMRFFMVLSIVVYIIPLIIACYYGLSAWEYVKKLLLPSLPFLLLCFDNYRNHHDIVEQQELKSGSLNTILKSGQEVIPEMLIKTQDAVFENRKKPALVPDLLYWHLRGRFQSTMENDAFLQQQNN